MMPVVSMLPGQRQALARFSVSALVASLPPLLYVSLLRMPPASLAGDTAFWFLMSNCVIAAIVAADNAGTLLSSSKANPRGGEDGVVSGGQPAALDGALVRSLAASRDGPAAANMEGGCVQEEVAGTMMKSSKSTIDGALPFLIHGEDGDEDEDAASKSSRADHNHALVLQRGDEDEAAAIEPSTDKNNTVAAEGQGGGGVDVASPSSASDEAAMDLDELAITEAGRVLAEPEPEPWPRVVTSKSLAEEDEADDDVEWTTALCSRTPDVHQEDKGDGAMWEGKLRRAATEGSKPAAEEKEYWELSDEELNRRVEEFIARFNREMRLQIQQEAGV